MLVLSGPQCCQRLRVRPSGLGLGVSGAGLRLGLGDGSSERHLGLRRRTGLGLNPGSIAGLRMGFTVVGMGCWCSGSFQSLTVDFSAARTWKPRQVRLDVHKGGNLLPFIRADSFFKIRRLVSSTARRDATAQFGTSAGTRRRDILKRAWLLLMTELICGSHRLCAQVRDLLFNQIADSMFD